MGRSPGQIILLGRLALLIVLPLALARCGLLGPPRWVSSYPVADEYVYGVGSAGVTFDENPARSREIAQQRALDDLARQIRVRVTSATIAAEREASSYFEARSIQFTDEDLEGIELVEVWVDSWGRAGKPDQTWVLVRLARARAEALARRSRY